MVKTMPGQANKKIKYIVIAVAIATAMLLFAPMLLLIIGPIGLVVWWIVRQKARHAKQQYQNKLTTKNQSYKNLLN